MQQRKNHQDSSLESQNVPFYVNPKNDDFLQLSKKLKGVKVIPFGVLYSWLTFGRFKKCDFEYRARLFILRLALSMQTVW